MSRFVISDEARSGIVIRRKSGLKFVDGRFITKYDDAQPRDEAGRWTSGGGQPMPYALTPQETKPGRLYYLTPTSRYYEVPATPEQKVAALLARSAAIADPTAPKPWDILHEPGAPQPPVTDAQIKETLAGIGWASREGWTTIEQVPPENQSEVIERAIEQHLGADAVQAYYAEQRDYLFERMGDLKLADGQTVREVMNTMADDALSQLQELAQASPVSLTMPSSRLAKLLGDERYKTVFEVTSPGKGLARGAYIESRTAGETRLGVPENVQPEDRPVYATLGGGGAEYGDSTVTLDDSVKDRTTVSIGDSLDGHVGALFNLGDLADGSVSREQFWKAAGDRVADWGGNDHVSSWFQFQPENDYAVITGYKGIEDVRKVGDYHYVEAQVHGGVSLSDVASITVNPDVKISGPNQAKLDNLGITVNREQSTWTKD